MPTDSAASPSRQGLRGLLRWLVLFRGVGMALLLLEALLALVILIAIVWWTMFAGRRKGELRTPDPADSHDPGDTGKP